MEKKFISKSSYYITNQSGEIEYYDREGNFLQSSNETNLLDPNSKGMANVAKIIFSTNDNLEIKINFIDKNSNTIFSDNYHWGSFGLDDILRSYRHNYYSSDVELYYLTCVDLPKLKNSNIIIDASAVEKIRIPNSSYHITKRLLDKQIAIYYDRLGNELATIDLLKNEYNHDSSRRLYQLLDPETKGMVQIKKISFSRHIKLGLVIIFMDKNDNMIIYQRYGGNSWEKNEIANYYLNPKGPNHYFINKIIDFDYIKNNDVQVVRYDPKLNVGKICNLF